MTVALIRHGQTDWNFARKVQGHTDIPLNETGIAQAVAAAKALQKNSFENGLEWRTITSSPLKRARQTAEIIAEHLGLELLDAEEVLIEQHYGIAEGLSVDELRQKWPDRMIPGAENPVDVADRGMRALETLDALGPHVLAVSHGAFIRRIIASVAQLEYDDVPGIENAKSNELLKTQDNWRVLKVNSLPAKDSLPKSASMSQDLGGAKFMMLGDTGNTCSIEGVC